MTAPPPTVENALLRTLPCRCGATMHRVGTVGNGHGWHCGACGRHC